MINFSVCDWTVQGAVAAPAISIEPSGDDDTAAIGALSFEIGCFITDNVAVSSSATVSLFDFGQTSAISFGPQPRVSYFFNRPYHLVLYVGAQGGYGYFGMDSGVRLRRADLSRACGYLYSAEHPQFHWSASPVFAN